MSSQLDVNQSVWLGVKCYHTDRGGIPGCPEHLDWTSEQGTLSDAIAAGLRPCKSCQPVDYRGES